MANTLVSLPRPIWVFNIAGYLHPRDLLHLRAVNRASNSFINSLLPDLAAVCDRQAQAIVDAVPQETRTQGETQYQLLEPARQCITSLELSPRDLAEVSSFSNPPMMVLQVLNVVFCLYNEERKALSWIEVKKAIKVSGFLESLKQKFISSTVRTIPENPDYTAAWFNAAQAGNVSHACSVLVQMAQSYLNLQQCYQTPAVMTWLRLQEQLKTVEREKNVYVRMLQGMPEEARSQGAPPRAGKRAGSQSVKKAGRK